MTPSTATPTHSGLPSAVNAPRRARLNMRRAQNPQAWNWRQGMESLAPCNATTAPASGAPASDLALPLRLTPLPAG
ncbi:MAG: hypothetical protein ABI743_13665 [bacterium]